MRKYVFLGDTLLNDEPLGIQRFSYELLKQIDAMERQYDIEVLVPTGMECKLSLKTIPIIQYGNYGNPFIWRQYHFANYVKKRRAIAIDLTLGLIVRSCGVVGLFDSIYENYPADFIGVKAKIKRYAYLVRARYVTKRARRIVTISEYSKKELLQNYKWLDNIDVLNCGWQHYDRIKPDTSIMDKLGVATGDYIFSLGSSLPHKNFEWIIRAAQQNPDYLFVVTGTNRLSHYQEGLNVANLTNIIFTGFLRDEEVKELMSKCKAFVHPSKYEGFGIPPLEALSCGAKVCVSDSTCLPEIFGDSVVYFDPDAQHIDISVLISKSTAQPDVILCKYDWKKTGMQFNQILKTI